MIYNAAEVTAVADSMDCLGRGECMDNRELGALGVLR